MTPHTIDHGVSTIDQTVLPPNGEYRVRCVQRVRDLLAKPAANRGITLTLHNGESVELPEELEVVLRKCVATMLADQPISITTLDRRLTTQQAADMLGVSRPTFVKWLEEGAIPFEKLGRHRRVLLTDVLAMRDRAREHRLEGLEQIREISAQLGLYELCDVPPVRTR